MTDPLRDTFRLHAWLERIRAGDRAARDELLRHFCARLERLARKMLRHFPHVAQWVQTDDVLQNSLLRLLRALEHVQPDSTRAFFALAAEQMRRELIDLARHYFGPHGPGTHQAGATQGGATATYLPEPPDRADDPADLEQWCQFHQEVERLPNEEREVVGLIFYHGWPQAQVAQLLQMSVRTVRRRWESAMVLLHQALRGGQPPGARD